MRSAGDRGALVVRLAEAIAAATGEDVDSLPPLASYVDLDALVTLVECSDVPMGITLELYGCTVDVDGAGNVEARPTDATGAGPSSPH